MQARVVPSPAQSLEIQVCYGINMLKNTSLHQHFHFLQEPTVSALKQLHFTSSGSLETHSTVRLTHIPYSILNTSSLSWLCVARCCIDKRSPVGLYIHLSFDTILIIQSSTYIAYLGVWSAAAILYLESYVCVCVFVCERQRVVKGIVSVHKDQMLVK